MLALLMGMSLTACGRKSAEAPNDFPAAYDYGSDSHAAKDAGTGGK